MSYINTEIVEPNICNFIKSLRDIGYTFEVAVADIIDNSITANSSEINIYIVTEPNIYLAILDNGNGMTSKELINAMRLASNSPEMERGKNDLGRFGLGLKTSSFSQCRKLTVISKKNNEIAARKWDLDYISKNNQWLLIAPEKKEFEKLPLVNVLEQQIQGTLIIWEDIDRYTKESFVDKIDDLRKHLAMVFHRFLEGINGSSKLKISINNNCIRSFNPFNINHPATQQLAKEKIKFHNSEIIIQPFILPHHSKVSQHEFEQYATAEGYIKSQGFYLYRANRLLIYGTWWGLHRSTDAHKLVRIKIDIPNNQDYYWGIDIKKSMANPVSEIKKDLKRLIGQVTEKGSRIYTGRGKKILDKSVVRFWELIPKDGKITFELNKNNPILRKVEEDIDEDSLIMLNSYLKCIQVYLPLDSIQAEMQNSPNRIHQEKLMNENDIVQLANKIKLMNLDDNYIEELLKTEIFKNRKELF